MKSTQKFLGLLVMIFISACNNYEKDGDKVYYNSWNEGSGSHKYQLVDVDAFEAARVDIEKQRNDEYSLARAGWRNADHTRRKLRDVLVFRLRTFVVDRRMGTDRDQS